MDSRANGRSTTEAEDDVYANTEECHPKSKNCPDASNQTKLKDKMKTMKLFIPALGFLVILGTLTILCAVGVLPNQNNSKCEEGWKSLGLKCYYFSTEKLNWTQSRDYCVKKGGHLVIITSQTEQSSVSSKIKESHWIGLNDLETEGKWMWVNNQPLKETDVKFWYRSREGPSEPDNWTNEDPSGENCAALGNEVGPFHKWFDASCRKLKLFICEK